MVLEALGQLGGMGTSGLVSHWLGGRLPDCERWAVGGIFRKMANEAVERGFALLPEEPEHGSVSPHGWTGGMLAAGVPFDPYAMAAYLDERVSNAGIEVSFFSRAIGVRKEDNRISHVLVASPDGLAAVASRAVVDATGNAEMAWRAGCPTDKGRPRDGLMAPATLMFHVFNVDQQALSDYIQQNDATRFREKVKTLRAAGEWPFPYDIVISVQLTQPGTMMINTSRLTDVDGTDTQSLSQGMIRGRRETMQLLSLLRKHFPGFQQARIKAVAPAMGIRETRRIRGAFRLTVSDLNRGRRFSDTIGFSAYGWDLPDPKNPSVNPGHGHHQEVVPIPYRTLLPQRVDNLICPGRVVSVEHAVLGPLRVQAPCMAMGEAAGQACGQIVQNNAAFHDIDIKKLRRQLIDQGAIVEWPVSD